MPVEVFGNDATATVTSGGTTAPTAGTTESWTLSGSTLPACSSSATPPQQFYVADRATGYSTEKILVTNISGTTATVTRGADGTTPVAHLAGFSVQQVLTRASFKAFQLSSGLDWVNVVSLGADPTGAVACDTVVNAAITALGSQGGVIYFPAGTYKISTGLVAHLANSQTVTIVGDGGVTTILMYYGSGDCIRLYNSTAFGGGGAADSDFSGIHDLTIDGTNATGSAAGIHAGDITYLQIQDVIVRNFTGTGQIPVHFENTVNWTEEGDFRIGVSNCAGGVVLDVTTGYNSYGYCNFDLTFVNTLPQQSFFSVLNGALFYHGKLQMRGNGTGTTAAITGNPATIVVSGLLPSTSPDYNATQPAGAAILACELDVQLEPNNGAGSNMISTMYLDAATFGIIQECYGILDWSAGTGSFTPVATAALTGNNGNFGAFSGIVNGDAHLNPSGVLDWRTYGNGTIANYLPNVTISGASFPTEQADVFLTTLTANVTAALNFTGAGDGNTFPGPQRKLLYIKQDATGGRTVTWPSTGTPTTTTPTIVWAGGVPPVLSRLPSAVDVIELLTWDGVTWYGRQLFDYGTAAGQNVALAPERQRTTLTTAFTSVNPSTTQQSVTGMSALLGVGTYRLKGWFPCSPAGTTGSTQQFVWTFSGTASAAAVKWNTTAGTTASPVTGVTLTTASAAATMVAGGMFVDFEALVTTSAAGTLQLKVTGGTAADLVKVPAGSYLEIEPLA